MVPFLTIGDIGAVDDDVDGEVVPKEWGPEAL